MQIARGYANLEETVIRVDHGRGIAIPRINLTPHAFTAVILSGYSQPSFVLVFPSVFSLS